MPIILDGTTGITTPGITNTGTFVFQGPVQVPAGSAATASITTAAGANTGIFFPSSSSVAITTAGTEKFSVGTGLVINDGGLDFDTRIEGDTDANLVFVDASTDRIGIGTSSPATKLNLGGSSDQSIQINGSGTAAYVGTSTAVAQISSNRNPTTGAIYDANRAVSYINLEASNGNGNIQFYTTATNNVNATERMRLDSSGNLGLGVTPSAWSGATGLQVLNASLYAAGNIIGFAGNSYLGDAGANDKYIANGTAVKYLGNVSGDHRWYVAASGSAGGTISFTQAMTLDASGNFGVGRTSIVGSAGGATIEASGCLVTGGPLVAHQTSRGVFEFNSDKTSIRSYGATAGTGFIAFNTGGGGGSADSERARITSGGDLLVGKSASAIGDPGTEITSTGLVQITRDSAVPVIINRLTNDGDLISFRQASTEEGSISVSGNTVSYNAFAGSHWSQLQDGSKPDILRGTVMESINELCEWPDETNERLPKSKISDTAGSKKVYGVFMAWDNDWTATNDMYVTAVGAFICRVNGSVTVQEGDLLESNGDGTARVQADDIIRSSTIGKVTSTVKTHQYDDGSYCVPTVLYCG